MVGPFADELMTAHLTEDSWRHRHDSLKVTIVNMCNEARVPVRFLEYSEILYLLLSQQRGENCSLAGNARDFVQTFVCAFQLRPVRLTHWAN